jgi:hypothetical protein
VQWFIHAPTAAVAFVAVALAFGIAASHLHLDDGTSKARTVHGYLYGVFGMVIFGFSVVAANGERAGQDALGTSAVVLFALSAATFIFAGFHLQRGKRHDRVFSYANVTLGVALSNLASRSAEHSRAGDNGIAFHGLSIFLNDLLFAHVVIMAAILLFIVAVQAIKYARKELRQGG